MSTYENLAESNRATLRARFGEGGAKSVPEQMAEWWRRWRAKKPRQYRMGWCRKCRRSYRLPLSADPKLAPLAQCDHCFAAEMEALSCELARQTGKSTA